MIRSQRAYAKDKINKLFLYAYRVSIVYIAQIFNNKYVKYIYKNNISHSLKLFSKIIKKFRLEFYIF